MSLLKRFFDRLRTRETELQRQRLSTYSEVVAALATDPDNPPPEDDVASILEEAGKSVIDLLGSDVELYANRKRWRDQLDRLPELQARQQQIAAKLESSERHRAETIAAANREYEENVQPLKLESHQLESAISLAADARNRLMETSGKLPEVCRVLERGKREGFTQWGESDRLARKQRECAARVTNYRHRLIAFDKQRESRPMLDFNDHRANEARAEIQTNLDNAVVRLSRVDAEIEQRKEISAAARRDADAIEMEALKA